MSDAVIRVERIAKRYRLGEVGTGTLRHDFNRWWHRVRGKDDPYALVGEAGRQTGNGDDCFWALKDVSFEVNRGEVLGIIGRNGAGKSTLLKILSRVTSPTLGQAKVRGRIASLLEVGTGFHPELTGRENIYLNGAILGMQRSEIAQKFDEIVEFAEVAKFLDTPVKRYSSGMYVRLAFAVAAHLEPEILIVDEVLAVGDGEFQKKCLGRMHQVSQGGRTVLFVSHNLGAVQALCNRVVWLANGQIHADGAPSEVVSQYVSSGESWSARRRVREEQRRAGDNAVRIVEAALRGADCVERTAFMIGEPFEVELSYQTDRSTDGTFFLLIANSEGRTIVSSFQSDTHDPFYLHGSNRVFVLLDDLALLPGEYFVSAGIFDGRRRFIDWAENLLRFEVLTRFADGRVWDHRLGELTKKLSWSHGEPETLVASNAVRASSGV